MGFALLHPPYFQFDWGLESLEIRSVLKAPRGGGAHYPTVGEWHCR